MRVLVVGSGAREHALALAILADPDVTEVVVAPGNAGIAESTRTRPLDVTDTAAVAAAAVAEEVDLVVIGPEVPLVAGAADAVRAAGIACFGPSADAARLEGSKAFAKEVMAEAGVPTALAHVCDSEEQVALALDQFGAPYVVKDDGLAAGKGVVVTADRAAALAHAVTCLAAGSTVVVEEFLDGPEVSLFAITDGMTALPLQPAQDFKRVGEGDVGPNTGGMGAYAPLPWAPDGLVADVLERVIEPVVSTMRHRGTPFAGLLYAGLALTSRGVRVVEFNARFGDPETQVVLANLRTPLGALLLAAATGRLHEVPPLVWESGYAVTVVVAAAGYPDSPRSGDEVGGLAEAGQVPGVVVLHAGTRRREDGRLVTSGGRVLSVTARGDTVESARTHAYQAVDLLRIDGAHHRRDIAGGRMPE